jgi:hypothetical protein
MLSHRGCAGTPRGRRESAIVDRRGAPSRRGGRGGAVRPRLRDRLADPARRPVLPGGHQRGAVRRARRRRRHARPAGPPVHRAVVRRVDGAGRRLRVLGGRSGVVGAAGDQRRGDPVPLGRRHRLPGLPGARRGRSAALPERRRGARPLAAHLRRRHDVGRRRFAQLGDRARGDRRPDLAGRAADVGALPRLSGAGRRPDRPGGGDGGADEAPCCPWCSPAPGWSR